MPKPKVFLIDPDEVARGVVSQIAMDMELTSEFYSDAEGFLAEYDDCSGCVVTEIRLSRMSGLDLLEFLRSEHPSLPVVFATAHAETMLVVQAMRSGAVSVLDKPFSSHQLWDAVRRALTVGDQLRRIESKRAELRRRLARLTKKERQVLDLMTQGRSNKVIARQLDVSLRTVEARRHQIFRKTETDSVAELLRLIFQTQVEAISPSATSGLPQSLQAVERLAAHFP